MNHPIHTRESKSCPNLPQISTEILASLQKTKDLVNGAIRNMREQEEILLEKKRKIEEIALMCERSGDGEVIPFGKIIRESGDVNKKDKDEEIGIDTGYTVLMRASYAGNLALVKMLLDHPDILVNEKYAYTTEATTFAGMGRHIEIVKLFLNHSKLSTDMGTRKMFEKIISDFEKVTSGLKKL